MKTKTHLSALGLYTEELAKYDPLPKDEELKLARKMQRGNAEAREKLIRSNLRFVVRIAKHYDKGALPLEDLIGIGNEGLLRAAEDFDPDAGARFISYAVWWIRASILAALADERTIRLPRNKVGELIRILRTRDHSDKLSVDRLGKDLHLKPELISQLLQLSDEPTSLEARTNSQYDIHDTLLECLGDKQAEPPERSALAKDFKEALLKALDTLPERERLVLEYRYGLRGKKRLWLNEIGVKLGVTKERVRGIEKHALMTLFKDHKQALEQYLELED